MKILGFQSGHDVSYVILENGVPIIYEELERFIRQKEPLGDGLNMFFNRWHKKNYDDIKYFAFGNYTGRNGKWKKKCGLQKAEDRMQKILKKNNAKYYELGHHKSHAANAFFSSNFDTSLIITVDGGGHEEYGEITALTVWEGKNNKIYPIKIFDILELNIGGNWEKFTRDIFGLSAGFPKGNQAGTVMAMGTMGNPDIFFKDFYNSKLDIGKEKTIYFKELAKKNEETKFNIAAAIQKATEEIFFNYIEPYVYKNDYENLSLSGGVALNSVMIGKIQERFPKIKEIFVCPIPYDGGLAIGAAQYVWHHILNKPRIKWDDSSSPFLGYQYDEDDINKQILKYKSKIEFKLVQEDFVLDLLNKQKIISIFGGGSEGGRRALGNRSILADPRRIEMKDIINEKIKHRQWFRPFAPSILREDVKEWFIKDIDSPYMSFVVKYKDEVKEKVPAVVHFDNSGRLQTVTEKSNKWYYNFIKKWKEKTGVPILLNTSFNDREPIVETPEHAINCFLLTDLDYLFFYDINVLVNKRKRNKEKKKKKKLIFEIFPMKKLPSQW